MNKKRQLPRFNKERAKLQNSGTLPPVETNTDWAIKQGINMIPDAGPSHMDADTYLRLHGTTNAGAGINYQKPNTFLGPYNTVGAPKYREPSDVNPMFDDFGIPITMKNTNVQRFEPGETVKYNLGKNNRLEEYAEYGVNVIAGDEYDKKRAQAQGTGEQIWRGLAGAAGGIVLGVAENVGYLGGMLFDSDYDYDNWLTDIAKRGRDWWSESVIGNVYRENPNATFDLGDPAWWIEHGTGLVESVGEFAITGGAVGALAKAAKVSNAIMSAKNANKLMTGAQWATAGLLAYTEGAMTGAEVYQNSYDKLRRQGVSHLDAVRRASVGASTAVRLNTAVNTLLNVTSAGVFFGNKNPLNVTKLDSKGNKIKMDADDALKQSLNLGDPQLAKKAINAIEDPKYTWKDMFKKASIKEAPQEAAEEVINTWAEKSGERKAMEQTQPHLVNKALSVSSLLEKMTELANLPGDAFTQEGLLAAVLGAAGGVGQSVITEGIPMHKDYEVLKEDQVLPDGKVLKAGEFKLDEKGNKIAKGRVSGVELENRRQQQEFNRKKALIVDDLNDIIDTLDKVNTIRQDTTLNEDQKQAQIDDLHNKLFSSEIRRSVMAGTADNLMSTYKFLENVDNSTPVGLKPEVVKRIKDLETAINTKTQSDPNADVKAEQEELDKLKKLSSTETDAMRRGLAKDMNDNSYKEKAKQAQEQIKEYKKLYEELSAKFDYGDTDSKHHMMSLYNLSAMKNYREKLVKKYREDLDKATKQVLEDLDKNQSAANPKVKEAFVLNEEIKALNKQLEYIQQTTHDLNELITKGNMDDVIQYLSGLYPDVYNNLAADKKNTKNDIARGLVEEYAKKRKESVDAINNNIKSLSTKRNNAFNDAYTLVTGEEGILESDAYYSPDEFDSKLSSYVGDIAQGTRDSVKNAHENIKKLEEEIATADRALAELKSTKGRDKFIKAVKKYQTALFKELNDQAKPEEKEAKKDKSDTKDKDSTSKKTQSDPNGEDVDTTPDLTIDPKNLVDTGNTDISKPFSWNDAVELPIASDSEDNRRLKEILLNLNVTGILPETMVKLDNKPTAKWSGMYDKSKNLISVNVAHTLKNRYLYTLLHESIHAGVAQNVRGGDINAFVSDINNYLDLVVETITGKKGTLSDLVKHVNLMMASADNPARKQQLSIVSQRLSTLSGMKDKVLRAEEVVTYVFSSPELAQFLSEYKITSAYDKNKRSLWRVIMEYVMQVLNIDSTLVGELINITNKYMGVIEYDKGMQFVNSSGTILTIQDKQINNGVEEFIMADGSLITHDELVLAVTTGELSTRVFYEYMVQVRAIESLEKELRTPGVTDARIDEIEKLLKSVNIAVGDAKLEKALSARLKAIETIIANRNLLFKITDPNRIIASYMNLLTTDPAKAREELRGTGGSFINAINNKNIDIETLLNYIDNLVRIVDGNNIVVITEFLGALNNNIHELITKKVDSAVSDDDTANALLDKLESLISSVNSHIEANNNKAGGTGIVIGSKIDIDDIRNRVFYEIATKLNRLFNSKRIYAQVKKNYADSMSWQFMESKTIYKVEATVDSAGNTKYILTPFDKSLNVVELDPEDYFDNYHEINSGKSLSRHERSELYNKDYIFTNMVHASVGDRVINEHMRSMLLNSAKLAINELISDPSVDNAQLQSKLIGGILRGYVDNLRPDNSKVLFEKIDKLASDMSKVTAKTSTSDIAAIYNAFEEYLLGNTSTAAPEFTFNHKNKIKANTTHAKLLELASQGVDVNSLRQRVRITRRISVDQNRRLHSNNGPEYTKADLLSTSGTHVTFLPEQIKRINNNQPAIGFKRYLDADALLEIEVEPGMWIPLQPRAVKNIVKVVPTTKPDGTIVYTEQEFNPAILYRQYKAAATDIEKEAVLTELNTYFSINGSNLDFNEFESVATNFEIAEQMWNKILDESTLQQLDANPGSDVIFDNEHFYDISFGGGSLNFSKGAVHSVDSLVSSLNLNDPNSAHRLNSNMAFAIVTIDSIEAADEGLQLAKTYSFYDVEENSDTTQVAKIDVGIQKELESYVKKLATKDDQIKRQMIVVRDLNGKLRHINMLTADGSSDVAEAGKKLITELATYAKEILEINEKIKNTTDPGEKKNLISELTNINTKVSKLLNDNNLYIPVKPLDNLTSIKVDFKVNIQVDMNKYDTDATAKAPIQIVVKTKKGQKQTVKSIGVPLSALVGADGQPLSLDMFIQNMDSPKVAKAMEVDPSYKLSFRQSLPKGVVLENNRVHGSYQITGINIPPFVNNTVYMKPIDTSKFDSSRIQKFTLSPSDVTKGLYTVVKQVETDKGITLQPGTKIYVNEIKRAGGGYSVKFVVVREDGSYDTVINSMGRAAFSTFVAKASEAEEKQEQQQQQTKTDRTNYDIGTEYEASDFAKLADMVIAIKDANDNNTVPPTPTSEQIQLISNYTSLYNEMLVALSENDLDFIQRVASSSKPEEPKLTIEEQIAVLEKELKDGIEYHSGKEFVRVTTYEGDTGHGKEIFQIRETRDGKKKILYDSFTNLNEEPEWTIRTEYNGQLTNEVILDGWLSDVVMIRDQNEKEYYDEWRAKYPGAKTVKEKFIESYQTQIDALKAQLPSKQPIISNLDRIVDPVVYKFGAYKGVNGIVTDGRRIDWDKNTLGIGLNAKGSYFVRINKDGRELAVYANSDVLDAALRKGGFMALAIEIPVDITDTELSLVYKALEESFEEMINSSDGNILTKKPSGASYVVASPTPPTDQALTNDLNAVRDLIYKNIDKYKTKAPATPIVPITPTSTPQDEVSIQKDEIINFLSDSTNLSAFIDALNTFNGDDVVDSIVPISQNPLMKKMSGVNDLVNKGNFDYGAFRDNLISAGILVEDASSMITDVDIDAIRTFDASKEMALNYALITSNSMFSSISKTEGCK